MEQWIAFLLSLGIILLLVEIFLIPGFGITGGLGFIFLIGCRSFQGIGDILRSRYAPVASVRSCCIGTLLTTINKELYVQYAR